MDCGRILQDSISLTEDERWRGLNKLMERMPWDTKYDELDRGHFTTSKRCECDTQLTLSSYVERKNERGAYHPSSSLLI